MLAMSLLTLSSVGLVLLHTKVTLVHGFLLLFHEVAFENCASVAWSVFLLIFKHHCNIMDGYELTWNYAQRHHVWWQVLVVLLCCSLVLSWQPAWAKQASGKPKVTQKVRGQAKQVRKAKASNIRLSSRHIGQTSVNKSVTHLPKNEVRDTRLSCRRGRTEPLLTAPGTRHEKGKRVRPTCYPYVSPYLPVRAALLYNLTTKQILYQHNIDAPIPPASLTKVMTLYLTFERIKQGRLSLQKRVRVSKVAARTGGSSMHLRPGEVLPLAKLITGTAVASGNDAAMAVAEAVTGRLSSFVNLMNAKAKALGMRQTRFMNPTGLPAYGQVTTAHDLFKLALSYLHNFPEAMQFHGLSTFSHSGRLLCTTNTLLGAVCGVNGLKTGWTIASGYNIIVTAKRGQTKLLLVVMGGRTRISRDFTARKLLEAGFRNPALPALVRSAFLGGKKEVRGRKKVKPS